MSYEYIFTSLTLVQCIFRKELKWGKGNIHQTYSLLEYLYCSLAMFILNQSIMKFKKKKYLEHFENKRCCIKLIMKSWFCKCTYQLVAWYKHGIIFLLHKIGFYILRIAWIIMKNERNFSQLRYPYTPYCSSSV